MSCAVSATLGLLLNELLDELLGECCFGVAA